MSRPRLIALLLALGTLVVFLPVARFGFLNYDDNDYVTDNQPVKDGLGWAGIKWAFTTRHADNWHPLTWISHMADCSLFGLNPGAHHFVNVLFHAANAALLFALLLRLTGKLWPSAFVAALFAWHPLHIESVAWIAERKDVLSAFFGLLALLSYTKFAQENSRRDFWLAVLYFALGLLAKPMLVTLPFVMLLLDVWPLQRISGANAARLRLVTEKWPFFALTVASCFATIFAQSLAVHGRSAIMPLNFVPLHYRFESVPVAYATYLFKLAWPANLSVFYPLANVIPAARVVESGIFLLLISILCWRERRRLPCLPIGWLWFLGMLVPVIGLVQVGGAALADRYSYLPSIGIFVIVAFAGEALTARWPVLKKFLAAAAVTCLAASLVATEIQLQFWRDSETLFRHALAVTEDNDVARNNLAIALEEKGDLPGALTNYLAAAKLAPDREIIHNNLASVYAKLGHDQDALAEYRAASHCQPDDAVPHALAGDELVALGDFDGAMKEYSAAEKLDPQYAWPHIGVAQINFKLGRDDEAVNELKSALRLAPENFQILATIAHYLAANENAAARDGQNALILAIKANELSGHSQPMVFDILGMAFAATGDFANAQTCVQSALGLATAAQMKNLGPLQKRLELYQNNQPWRESFRATNAPVKN